MALPTNKLQDILSLLPKEIHEKTKIIYQQIPGSLLNYFNPVSINKKVECREHNLPADSSIPIEHDTGRNYSERNFHRSDSQHGYPQDQSNSNFNNQPSYLYSVHENHDNKYENALRFHLRASIKRNFSNQNIIEVNPAFVADDIVQKCFEQCPDWGSKKCKTPSVIVRFDSNYILEQGSRSLNVNIYTYAYLACEREESHLPRFIHEATPQIRFEVTIELTGLAISFDKIVKFGQLLSNNTVTDVIQKIETTNKVTWENLDQLASKPSTETKPSLSWDDV
jgi:hypothetical protein